MSPSQRKTIIERLQRGDVVHMQFLDGERIWWFESPYLSFPCYDLETLLRDDLALVEYGDSLFGTRLQSQTWAAARGATQ